MTLILVSAVPILQAATFVPQFPLTLGGGRML